MTRDPVREIASVARMVHRLYRSGARTARDVAAGYAPAREFADCLQFVCRRIWLDPGEEFPADEGLTIFAFTEALMRYEYFPRTPPYTAKQYCEAVSRVCREFNLPECKEAE